MACDSFPVDGVHQWKWCSGGGGALGHWSQPLKWSDCGFVEGSCTADNTPDKPQMANRQNTGTTGEILGKSHRQVPISARIGVDWANR